MLPPSVFVANIGTFVYSAKQFCQKVVDYSYFILLSGHKVPFCSVLSFLSDLFFQRDKG